MDFLETVEDICADFRERKIQFGIIGGLALALHGIQRTTSDIDFLILLEETDIAGEVLVQKGYQCVFQNKHVSHYENPDTLLSRLDILHAAKPASRTLLKQLVYIKFLGRDVVPVVSIEGLIGLKVQAFTNDSERMLGDLADIKLLCESAASDEKVLNWKEIESYLSLFRRQDLLTDIKDWYERGTK